MSTNHTTNYNLNQWEATDKVLRTEFNEDNAKIDAALAGLAGTAAEHTAAIAQHAAAIPALGNCQIYTTSYVGNNKSGAANPTTLTFPHKPMFLMVFSGYRHIMAFPEGGWACVFVNITGVGEGLSCSLSGHTVSWYHGNNPALQLNESSTYRVVAFLDAAN